MIELDANGNIPQHDKLCRVYHVAGVKNGIPWSGLNTWSGEPHWKAKIEAYDTFRGWATPEISGDQRSVQPSEDFQRQLPVRLRIFLCKGSGHTQYLEVWNSESRDSQATCAQAGSFVAWVSDTLEPLPPLPAPVPPARLVSEELEVMVTQTGPLTQRQRDILVGVANKLKQTGE